MNHTERMRAIIRQAPAEMTARDMLVLLIIADAVAGGGDSPTTERIAEWAHMTRWSVSAALTHLKALGVLSVSRPYAGGRGRPGRAPNEYTVEWPAFGWCHSDRGVVSQ